MKKKILIAIICVVFVIFNDVYGQNYYVATTGNDANAGTITSPWKTITKAANTLTAGQIAYIRGGTYNEGVQIKNSGTEGNYISLIAYPNEKPIVDGTGKGTYYLMNLNQKSYIKVSGIRFQNGTIGIGNGASNILIENNEVANFSNPGIEVNSCSVAIVKGNIVDNVCNSSWGECITIGFSEYIDIAYNEVRNGSLTNTAGGEGIDIKSSKHVWVYGNVVHDLRKLGIYIDAYDGLDYDIEVFNNKVYNCNDGVVISSEQRNAVEKIHVYNNLLYDCIYIGIGVVNWPTHAAAGTWYPINDIIIENNTVSSTGGINIDARNGTNFIIRNNIIYNYSPLNYGIYPSSIILSNNLSNIGVVSALGTNGVLADPMFVNAILKDFRLTSSSPAIDKGASNAIANDYNFNIRPFGSACDIGAYEFGSIQQATIPTVAKPAFTLTTSTVSKLTDVGNENTSTGVVSLNNTSVNISFTSTTNKIIAAVRFANVNIPKGAKILNANIKLKMNQTRTWDNDPIRINAVSIGNSPVLNTNSKSISSIVKTTNYANWLPKAGSIGSWKSTPSLDFIVSELASCADWTSGNAMTFIFEYTDTAPAGTSFIFNSFDGNIANSPTLTIEYTLDTSTGIPTIINSTDNAVKVYPNPTKDYIKIDMQDNRFSEMEVFDILGKQILSQLVDPNSSVLVLNVKGWNKGIHFIRLRNENEISNNKIIIE